MKRIRMIGLVLLMLLTACRPTPDTDAVKQKNTNVLIETVQQSTPAAAQTADARFQCDFTTSAQAVRVTADVPIEVLSGSGMFPVLRVKHRYLTDSERLTIAQRLLDSDTLYLHEVHITRRMLESQIADLIQEPTPEEKAEWLRETDGTEEEWQQFLVRRRDQLAACQRQYNELPADDSAAPLAQWYGTAPVYSEDYEHHSNCDKIVRSETDTNYAEYLDYVTVWANETDRPIEFQIAGKDFSDLTSVWFFGAAKDGAVRIRPQDYDTPCASAAISPNDAAAAVESIFDGVNRFRIADVFWTNNGAENEAGKVIVTREAYLVVLTTDYDGANTVYSSQTVFDHDAETDVVRSWANEALMAAVDGEGRLLSLVWLAPLTVTDMIAESTSLLPQEDVARIFETQMGRQFAQEDDRNGTLHVDTVQLGLYRIREQNSFDTGLLVPAWFFTGTFTYSEPVQTARQTAGFPDWEAFRYDNLNPLLIVNAIDGSIIDPARGY